MLSPPGVTVMDSTRTGPDEDTRSLMIRLERGELITFSQAPFPLPQETDLSLLFSMQLASLSKNISYDPATGRVTGFVHDNLTQPKSLARIFGEFSRRVSTWLGSWLPPYASACIADRATFRSEEEATRRLRLTARNDLLH